MRIRTTLVAPMLAALLCGASGAPAPAPTVAADEPRRGGEATAATLADLAGVNELVSGRYGFTNEALDQMFLQLLREQPDYADHPPTLAPELATSYEFSPDRRTLTFRLRADVRWSDGEPVTAEDVRFSWQAQRSPEVAWAFADSKDAITDVEVIDPQTARFHFSEVYPYQLVDANDGKILPRHLWSQLPFAAWPESADWFRDHIAVTGPFQLGAWQPNQEVVLERNQRYLDPALPRLDRVRFRVVPDPAAQVEQLLAGSLDFLPSVGPDATVRLAVAPEVELLVFPGRQYEYICWNTGRPPFDDPDIRRALTLAIDRQALVDTLWRGYARVAASPILANVWARAKDLAPWPYDPREASRILAAKGFRDVDGDGILERGGHPFRFELTTNSANRVRSDAVVLIQEQLRRVGVDVEPRTLEMQTLTAANLAHGFDATLGGWAVDTTLDLRPYFHSGEAHGGYNFGSYSNPELDRLLVAVRQVADLEATRPMFDRIQRILHAEQPYTFLWESQRLAAVRRELGAVEPNALSSLASVARWWRRAPAPRG
jgi:peptide/nickel transport system substrate-binding protein